MSPAKTPPTHLPDPMDPAFPEALEALLQRAAAEAKEEHWRYGDCIISTDGSGKPVRVWADGSRLSRG